MYDMANPKGPNRSWKKDQNKTQPDAAGKRSWQQGSTSNEPKASNASRRILLRVMVFLGLVLVAGLITYVILHGGGTKPLTMILLAHHDANALNSPCNVYAAHSELDLESWASEDTVNRKAIRPPVANFTRKEQTSKDWLNWLINEGKKAGDIVVYYFGMPGHADAELGPYLWLVPSEASLPETKHKLFVSDLLDKVQNELKKKKVLLIFDASQVDHSIVHGMVTTDFSRSLKSLEEKVSNIPDCYILNSCSENQLSWTSPELGKSIFSHYLSHGLRGAARESNGRLNISIKNLFDYVSSETDKWAQANRSAVQKPLLIPSKDMKVADTFVVVTISGAAARENAPHQRDTLLDVSPDWEKFYQLSQLSPAPEIVAPHQWKTYTALLLQLEKLYFAGAASNDISAVRRRLDTLASFITEQSKSPTWTKSPVTEDISAPDAKTRDKDALLLNASNKLNVLWKSDNPATIKEDVEKWKELIASTKNNPVQRKQLLIHSWRWTIERVTAEPNLVAAERVLALIEEELRPSLRPSDVHFVRMLVRDTQEKPWSLVRNKADLIKKAIDVRTKSERIAWLGSDTGASYASHWVQMNKWIAPDIKQADDLRRSAEDLLFDANESQWTRALDLLDKASAQYALASSKTQTLVNACQLRDQLYYQLPYYSDWAAMQSSPLVDQATQAWSQLHQLATLLQPDQKIDDKLIGTHANNLRKLFTELQSAYLKKVREEVRDTSVSTASAFLDVNSLLQQPLFADGYEGTTPADKAKAARDHRLILLRKLKDSSYRLSTNSQQPGKILEASSLYRPDSYADARLKLAHAQLGEEAIQLIKTSNVTPVILNWSVDRRNTPHEQITNLMQVSSKVGTYWSVLPLAMMKHKDAEKAYELMQATGTASTIGPAEKWMTQAAQFNRQLDPGTSEPQHKNNQLNATQTERWYFTHRFLLGQANRSQDEGWADLLPTEKDYSTKLASLYLDSAQELLGNLAKEKSVEAKDKGWHALVVNAKNRFAVAPGKLQLTIDAKAVPKQLFVTDEPFVKFAVGMKPIGSALSGYPIIRVWSPPGSDGVSTFALNEKMVADFKGFYSKPVPAADIPIDDPLNWINKQADQEPLSANTQPLSLRTVLLHRGHLYDNSDVHISMLSPPRLRWVKDAPDNKPGVVVFGEDYIRDGHIHIMFDTTHSMPHKVKGLSMTKLDAARQALERVLKLLPDDITLSISTFRGIVEKTHITANKVILPPTKWDDRNKHIERIMEAIPTVDSMNKEYAQGLRTQTPISRGINEIVNQDSNSPILEIDKNKPFTLLVLTDGAESEDETNTAERLLKDLLPCKLKQLVLHILLFSIDENNIENKAAAQAEILRMKEMDVMNTDDYRRHFLRVQRTPPQVWPSMDSVEILTRTLIDASRTRITIMQNGEPVPEASNQRVTKETDTVWNRLFLKKGSYQLFTAGLVQNFTLNQGDKLAMKIDRRGLNTQIVIPSIANLYPPLADQLKRKQGDVQMAMLDQQMASVSGGGHALQLQVMMEQPKLQTSRDTILERQRPRFAWFQLSPLLNDTDAANTSNINLTVTQQVNELAPVWTVEANPWPAKTKDANPLAAPAGYRLESYWVNTNAVSLTGSGIDFSNPSGATRPVSVNGSVGINEGGKLDVWNRKRGAVDWLYVHYTYPPGNPVLFQLRPKTESVGFTPPKIAEEHRFYLQANSVSAWFNLSTLEQDKELALDVYLVKDLIQQSEPNPNIIKFEFESSDVTKQKSALTSRRWNRD
jgi:uncharacterized protein (UPF0303 family)